MTVPGLGSMLLPGKVGFAEDNSWRFNPSYLPPTLAQYFTRFGAPVDYAARNQSTFIAGNRPERLFARLGAL